jgi:hypothetical protein
MSQHNSSDDEKGQQYAGGVIDRAYGDVEDPLEENEVFKKSHDGVDFRTVGWLRASIIFLKGTSYMIVSINSRFLPTCSKQLNDYIY